MELIWELHHSSIIREAPVLSEWAPGLRTGRCQFCCNDLQVGRGTELIIILDASQHQADQHFGARQGYSKSKGTPK